MRQSRKRNSACSGCDRMMPFRPNLRETPLHLLCAVLCILVHVCASAAAVREIDFPVTVKGLFSESQAKLVATEYRPDGDGPFPLILLNHGSPRSPADRVNT